jgi:hypothetical protein
MLEYLVGYPRISPWDRSFFFAWHGPVLHLIYAGDRLSFRVFGYAGGPGVAAGTSLSWNWPLVQSSASVAVPLYGLSGSTVPLAVSPAMRFSGGGCD